ncbi:MAG: polysaccharide biosynthesis C-terminal domain-containing protein [Lachnospiraceae bacterium]|nr:polysaccharide biosynthesis C-terminal domain-containing protein [Lachnospiraceae bacterium]
MKKLFGILKNEYVFSVFSKCYLILIGVVISAFKVAFLGKELNGRLFYITSMAQMLNNFFLMGYNQSYAYFRKKEGEGIRSDFLGSAVLLMLFYFAATGAFVLLFRPEREIMVIALTIPFFYFQKVLGATTMIDRPRLRNSVHMAADSCMLLFLLGLMLWASADFFWVIVIFLLVDLIRMLMYLIFNHPQMRIGRESFRFLKRILSYGFLPMLGTFLLNLNYKADAYMLKRGPGYEHLSIYSTGVIVADQSWMLSNAIAEILLSRLVNGKGEREVSRIIRCSNTITIFIQLIFLLLGKWMILLVYGPEYSDSYGILCLVMLGSYGMNYTRMIMAYCVAEGRQIEKTIFLFAAAALNIIMNLILIPIYGIVGAAMASVISYTVSGIMFLVFFRHRTKLPLKELFFLNREDLKALRAILRRKNEDG